MRPLQLYVYTIYIHISYWANVVFSLKFLQKRQKLSQICKIKRINFCENIFRHENLADFIFIYSKISPGEIFRWFSMKMLLKTQYLDSFSRKCSRKRTCLDDFCENVLRIWGVFTKFFNNIFAKIEKGISVSNLVLVNAYILYQIRQCKKKVVDTGRINPWVFLKIYPQNKN